MIERIDTFNWTSIEQCIREHEDKLNEIIAVVNQLQENLEALTKPTEADFEGLDPDNLL